MEVHMIVSYIQKIAKPQELCPPPLLHSKNLSNIEMPWKYVKFNLNDVCTSLPNNVIRVSSWYTKILQTWRPSICTGLLPWKAIQCNLNRLKPVILHYILHLVQFTISWPSKRKPSNGWSTLQFCPQPRF